MQSMTKRNLGNVMNVKVIKNKQDYEAAMQQLSLLLDKNPEPGSEAENILELLLVIIRDYEQSVIEPN